MAKNWYPEIDKEVCVSCGVCIERCKNNVYDKNLAPTPVVVNPDNCCGGCHGCGDMCPVGAITYFGEDK